MFLDQVAKILLFQSNLNPQRFQLMFHEGQMVTGVLTPPSYPGDLTLNGLELILNNVRNVVTFLLKVFSNSIPSKKTSAYLSHAVEGPMIISIIVLIMLSRLRRSHKPITNKSKRSHLIDWSHLSHDKIRTMGQPQCAALRSNHSQKTITCLGNEVGHCLLISPETNSDKNSTAAQQS